MGPFRQHVPVMDRFYTRIGVPINFTEAAEICQRAADDDSSDGANSLAICLERRFGIDRDVQRSVLSYRKAASQQHPSGMNNWSRCVEYEC
jgi:TPR repeat protein